MSTLRHCATGDHWAPVTSYREVRSGVLSKDCRTCERLRAEGLERKRALEREAERKRLDGVDIDRIYRVRPDLVKKR